jgi:subtilisin family serine protease
MEKSFFLSKKLYGILVGIFVFGFFFGCQNDLQLEDTNDMVTLKSAKTTNFMVISTSETLTGDLEKSLAKFGTIVKTIPQIGIVVVKTSDPNFETKVTKLANVRSVVPDLIVNSIAPKVQPMANPPSIGDDEWFFSLQWGMDAINAPEAWNAGYKGAGAKVFILDSGIDAEHPDLSPNLNTSLCKSFVPDEDWNVQPGDYFNHGTHVAGIVAAADNSFGVIGVAPMAEIVAVKVLSEYTGSGYFSWINEGIVYAAEQGADVINMSLGTVINKNGFYYDEDGNLIGKYSPKLIQELKHAVQRAINYAYKSGVTIVVAAGNSYMNADGNGSTIAILADLNNVIAVSATAPYGIIYDPNTNLDVIASYSNTGRSLINIAAPGGDFDLYFAEDPNSTNYVYDMVLSTSSESFYFAAGTSMASPHVAGVAALIIGKNGGQMDPIEVTKQLLKTADKIGGNGASVLYGKGRVNAFRAVTE